MNTILKQLKKEEARQAPISEELSDAQLRVNHTAKLIKDQLDLASKLIFQKK